MRKVEHRVTFIIVVLLAGCIPIAYKEYGGTWNRDLKSAKSKADLVDLAGEPDARSMDGRFYIYGHDTETEWFMTLFGYPDEEPTWTTKNQVRMLHEFDADNRILDYKIYKCQGVESSICNDDPQVSLWAAIQDVRGQQIAEEYRQSDTIAAVRIQLWHDAAKSGDVEVLEQLLEQGVTVRAELKGRTALYTAAREGHTDAVLLLLEQGAAVNVTDSLMGNPPIYAAAGQGHTSVVRSLLHEGADANVKTKHGDTPLLVAAFSGHVDVVKLLLSNGADVHPKTDSGDTSLHMAAESGNLEITQLLLARGAKVNVRRKRAGDTPLHVAARHGHTTIGELLLANGAKVNSRGGTFNGSTPLHYAVDSGHTAMVELLIQKGANVNSKAIAKTPLFKAVRNRDTVMAELLLAHGANVNANQTTWPRRYTLLELAKQQGDNDMIKLLKQHGAEE